MKNLKKQISAGFFVFAMYAFAPAQGGSNAYPLDPVEQAKHARVRQLIEQARGLVSTNDEQRAIETLNEAATLEATLRMGTAGRYSDAKYALARLFLKQNRTAEALEAYKFVFAWHPLKGELEGGGIHSAMEYAILLAEEGRTEDAKAMYYYGLRAYMFRSISRSQEPAPFLVVFDPEPEAIHWQYTLQRLEAAALMVQAMLGSGVQDFATNTWTSSRQFIDKARTLNPEWFYPVLFLANRADNGSAKEQQYLAEAQGLAKPGLEEQLMTGFRQSLEDWRLYCEQNNLAHRMATDNRPMTEGAERRKRMQCLRPNEQILRRLSIERPQ